MSDLFGGIIKPGDGARHSTERELHRRVEVWGHRSTLAYRGPADFILRHGRYYVGRETPAEYEHLRGPTSHCFGNALTAALEHPDLTYTEGVYVILGKVSEHAWCTAPDGLPVELTFPTDPVVLANALTPYIQHERDGRVEGDPRGGYAAPQPVSRWAYYGVEFPHAEFVRDIVLRTGKTAIIDKPEDGYPLLRQPWTPLMRRLP